MRPMVLRLMARWWASRRISKARVSRVHEESACWCSSVWLLAKLRTCKHSAGGKAPGSAGARSVLEALQASGHEAFPPTADGVPITPQLVGDLLVRGLVRLRGVQDQPAAKDQRLGSRVGADKGVE